MRTNKLLAFAAIALLLINGVLVYLLWSEKNDYRGRSGKRGDWFAEELKLDDKQKEEHKKLRDAHFGTVGPLFDSINVYRTSLFKLSKDSIANDSLVNYYIYKLSETHTIIARNTYEHFKKVRSILSPEQQLKYDEMIRKMMNKRGGPGKPDADKKDND